MVSQTTEYALRAIVLLAGRAERPVGTAEIAQATKVPAGYLAKVLQALARKGLVVSQPGRNGGFRLARSDTHITILDIVNAVDPLQRIEECPLGLDAHQGLCPLHRRLDDAIRLVERRFAQTAVADLLKTRPGCRGPSGTRSCRQDGRKKRTETQ